MLCNWLCHKECNDWSKGTLQNKTSIIPFSVRTVVYSLYFILLAILLEVIFSSSLFMLLIVVIMRIS